MISRIAQRHTFIPREAAKKLGVPLNWIPGDDSEVVLLRVLDKATGERTTAVGPAYWMHSYLAMVETAKQLLDSDPTTDPDAVLDMLDEKDLAGVFRFETKGWPEDWAVADSEAAA